MDAFMLNDHPFLILPKPCLLLFCQNNRDNYPEQDGLPETGLPIYDQSGVLDEIIPQHRDQHIGHQYNPKYKKERQQICFDFHTEIFKGFSFSTIKIVKQN
jgi:hypothetical protein